MPAPTEVQVPSLPVTLQAWQRGQAVVLQQMPSTQLPTAHGMAALQAAPSAPPLWHLPVESQKAPAAQSEAAVVQLVLHPEVVQA